MAEYKTPKKVKFRKQMRGPHGPDRVRAGGTNADLEQVECADSHCNGLGK